MNTKAVKIHTEFYSFLRIQKIAKSNFFHHHKISQINSTPFYLLFLHNFITSSFSTAPNPLSGSGCRPLWNHFPTFQKGIASFFLTIFLFPHPALQ